MTRESLARGVVVVTTLAAIGAVLGFAWVQERRAAAADRRAAEAAREETVDRGEQERGIALGKQVYDEQGCAACHSVAGKGNPRYPLDGVGGRLPPERIRLWIVAPQQARPGVPKPAYEDLPPQKLDALVAFLESLKEPRAPGG